MGSYTQGAQSAGNYPAPDRDVGFVLFGKTVAMQAASAGVGSLSWGNLDIRLGLRYSRIHSDLSGQI